MLVNGSPKHRWTSEPEPQASSPVSGTVWLLHYLNQILNWIRQIALFFIYWESGQFIFSYHLSLNSRKQLSRDISPASIAVWGLWNYSPWEVKVTLRLFPYSDVKELIRQIIIHQKKYIWDFVPPDPGRVASDSLLQIVNNLNSLFNKQNSIFKGKIFTDLMQGKMTENACLAYSAFSPGHKDS